MEEIENLFLLFVLTAGCILFKRRKRISRRRWGVRPINACRDQQGEFFHLFQEMKNDPEMFFTYTRMSVDKFYMLLEMVSLFLPERRHMKTRLSNEQRLAITLRYALHITYNQHFIYFE